MENHDLILDEQFHEEKQMDFVLASRGKRFANYIIDSVIFYIFFIGIMMLVALIFGPETISGFENLNRINDFLVTSFFGFIYYALLESLLKGRTVGKLITRTRVIDEYGNTPDIATTLKRSLCRFVPFDPLSFLGSGNGWHDGWSSTKVIEN